MNANPTQTQQERLEALVSAANLKLNVWRKSTQAWVVFVYVNEYRVDCFTTSMGQMVAVSRCRGLSPDKAIVKMIDRLTKMAQVKS
jgi:hypothetical protein